MTRVAMKRLPGGGYALDTGDHKFVIEANTDPVPGRYGLVQNRAFYVWIDGERRGGPFNFAHEAKDFVTPIIEQVYEKQRRQRQLAFWRNFAEELFPAGVPDNVMSAMEHYAAQIVVGEDPEDDPEPGGVPTPDEPDDNGTGASETVIEDEGTPETEEVKPEPEPEQREETPADVAAEVRKAAPRRSRAKAKDDGKDTKSKSTKATPKRTRRTSAKVEEKDQASEPANA